MKDQYDATLSGATVTEVKCVSKPANATEPVVTPVAGKLVIRATNATKGGYTYTVTATDAEKKTQTKSFSVNVVEPSGNIDYVLQFVGDSADVSGEKAIASMDATVNKDNITSKTISVNVAKRQSGVIVDALALNNPTTVSVASVKVIGSDGKTYFSANAAGTNTVTHAAIDDSAVTKAFAGTAANGSLFDVKVVDASNITGNGVAKNLPAGSYTVTVELKEKLTNGNIVTRTAVNNFKITDSQPVLTATVLATSTDKNSMATIVNDKDLMKYVYGGVTLDATTVKYVGEDSVKNGKTCVVKSVTIAVPIPGSTGNYVKLTAPINRVFTTNASSWS